MPDMSRIKNLSKDSIVMVPVIRRVCCITAQREGGDRSESVIGATDSEIVVIPTKPKDPSSCNAHVPSNPTANAMRKQWKLRSILF